MKKLCILTFVILILGWIRIPDTHASLAPADEVVSSETGVSRAEDLQVVRKVLEQKLVQQRLLDIGLTQEQIDARLDRLSDGQLHLLASQLNAVIPAGDSGTVWTIVGILLIVVLIILLAILL
jgi:hypothetical protein